jgi:hypothetical protein
MQPIIIKMQNDLNTRVQDSSEIFQTKAYNQLGKLLKEILSVIDSHSTSSKEPIIKHRVFNTIFIEGDRGTGKTTFLLNLYNMLKGENTQDDHSGVLSQLKFSQPIDPNFLDNSGGVQENFLSAIIACLFNHFQNDWHVAPGKQFQDDWYMPDEVDRTQPIFQAADKVAQSLKSLQEQPPIGLEKIVSFQSNFRLEQHLHEFFGSLKNYLGVKAIVLLIDDTDMSMEKCSEAIDIIHRYLTSPFVIPIVSGHKTLYEALLCKRFKKALYDQDRSRSDKPSLIDEKVAKLAEKVSQSYINKVFPNQYRIYLDSFPKIARDIPVIIELEDKTSIPLILLNEVHKRCLYRGLASRLYDSVWQKSREHLTAGVFLQRSKLHQEELKLVVAAYQNLEKSAERYFKIFYSDISSEKCKTILTDIKKIRGNKEFLYLTYDDMPHLVNAICADFFYNIYHDDSPYNHAELVTKWAEHNSYFHKDEKGEHRLLEWDHKCFIKKRFSTYHSFQNSCERIKNEFNGGPKRLFDINKFDLIAPKSVKGEKSTPTEAFFIKLLSEFLPTSHGKGWKKQITLHKFVHLMFRMFDNSTENELDDYCEILQLTDDKTLERTMDKAAYGYLYEILPFLNEWREKFHLSYRWIGSFQMDIILKKFRQSLDDYFNIVMEPGENYQLNVLTKEIAFLFLNAISCSEKERNVVDRNFTVHEDMEESDIYLFNIKQMVQSPYNSLTKIYYENPIIKYMREGSLNGILLIPTVEAEIEILTKSLLSFDGEINSMNQADISERINMFYQKLYEAKPHQITKKAIVGFLSKNNKCKRMFSIAPIQQTKQIAGFLGVDESILKGK